MSTLAESMAVAPGEVVAFVGAGAKTGALLRLVAELRDAGRKVVSTSTVSMSEARLPEPSYFLVEPDEEKILARVPALLDQFGHVRLASERLRADKISGVDRALVPRLAALPGVDNVLLEADGARHRALKAPNEREPSLPADVDVLVVSAGLDAAGSPLDEEHAHRPELVAALTGLAMGDLITPEAVAKVLASPEGGLKDAPGGARVYFLFTRWNPETDAAGREVARLALEQAPQALAAILLGAGEIEVITGRVQHD